MLTLPAGITVNQLSREAYDGLVAATRSGATESGELVVDDRGVVTETLGDTTVTRQ